MNSIMQAALNGFQQQKEANALIRLRDQLASRGVNSELRDNNSALMVHRAEPGLPVWVFVGYGGAFYSWQNAEKRHSVDDVEGAANVLAEYIAK
ncbi:hypothetical protein FE391_14575 [Nonomuraea sp. KC401]|uniref:hypothetical protein n=1 Tax=unclassified Nonomuraea TaxID=2593643 RepID=UPI0010FE7CA3|nr:MULTISPECIES: hypothetical protein [unclassified Nonomuraea]NBE98556.1 hypothetical protein [Nonomuraea sp. K271]TLF74220.1 hypothetical protein FE391_14575 [Nonomuraea sp. KC401]